MLVICLLLPFVSHASDVSKKDLAICASESNNIIRLECFDGLAKKAGVAGPKVSNLQSAGKWLSRVEVSPLDDSKNIYLSLESNDTIRSKYGKTIRPTLTIRCKENTTALSVWWGVYLGLDSTYVTHRIDKMKARDTEWSLSTKNEHIGKWNGRSSIPFIKKLFGKNKLLMQITPYADNSAIATFDVSGLESAIKPLRAQCGW